MNLQQFRKELKKYPGATLDEYELSLRIINVDAPQGFAWEANGCHSLTAPGAPLDFPNHLWIKERDQSFDELAQRMAYGLFECEEDCEICHN